MSQINPRLTRIESDFPDVVDVRDGGVCHCKHRAQMLFFWRAQLTGDRHRLDGSVMGGYYCAVCDFSNLGTMARERYEQAEVLKP